MQSLFSPPPRGLVNIDFSKFVVLMNYFLTLNIDPFHLLFCSITNGGLYSSTFFIKIFFYRIFPACPPSSSVSYRSLPTLLFSCSDSRAIPSHMFAPWFELNCSSSVSNSSFSFTKVFSESTLFAHGKAVQSFQLLHLLWEMI